ncbi:MAG: protein phosphatase 2C domain-containing protein [Deltaproteobacteria bacterium]|nr:protein phosphatase 2C domain-containing protein [Deltaproteobacteria bacterium]
MNTNDAAAAPVIRAAAGAVVGRSHRRLGRPCQDAWALAQTEAGSVAVVCDGCGSGARSEVGAVIGARLLAHAVTAAATEGAPLAEEATWLAIRDRVVAQLAPLVAAMGDDAVAIVREHFLFTAVCAAFTAEHAIVMAIGDGVFAIDGDVRALGPFADNQPPYLGYGLVGAAPALTAFEVRDASTVGTLLIATDGADGFVDGAIDAAGEPIGALTQFIASDRWFANPDLLRRRLAVINREDTAIDHARGAIVRRGAPLDDDTAIAVLRRTP